MNFRDMPQIEEKFGINVKLTTDNIKDIYIATNCNTYNYDSEITDFLEANYLQCDILLWNFEYYNNQIERCYNNILAEDNNLIAILVNFFNIQKLCDIYTDSYETYESIIDLLKAFYEKYGYFMHYPFKSAIKDGEILSVTSTAFALFYVKNEVKNNAKFKDAMRCHGCEKRYLQPDGFCGLLPRLYKLGFYDLFNRVITEIIVPICEHFLDENYPLFKRFRLYYTGSKDIKLLRLVGLIKEYATKLNITLPEEIKVYM